MDNEPPEQDWDYSDSPLVNLKKGEMVIFHLDQNGMFTRMDLSNVELRHMFTNGDDGENSLFYLYCDIDAEESQQIDLEEPTDYEGLNGGK